jgi:hypothetical protein
MIHNPDTIPYELCPLCLSDRFNLVYIVDIRRHRSFKPHFHHEGYWMRCVECDHEFRDGRWKPTRLEEIYSVDDPSQFQHFDIRRAESSEVVNKISQYKQNGTWLDVGFGDGALLITAQEYGYDCFGLDYRKENITRLLDFGIESFDFNFLSLKVKKRFDVISMCDVLEHIDFPRESQLLTGLAFFVRGCFAVCGWFALCLVTGLAFFVRGCFAVCGWFAVISKNKIQLIDSKNSAAHQA